MICTSNFARDRNELFQAQVISRVGWNSESIPGGTTVIADDTSTNSFLECCKSVANYRQKSRSSQGIQLLLRIVELVDVDDC